MNADDFVKCFLAALNDPAVSGKLGSLVGEQVQEQVQSFADALKRRDDEIERLSNKVNELENKLDHAEQYSRRNCLRILGLHEEEDEDTEAVTLNFINSEMALDPPLAIDEVDRLHRVGKRDDRDPVKQRGIIIKFTTYRSRARVLKAKKALHKKTFGPYDKPVYMNEDLTRKRSKILFAARGLKRDKRIADAWSHDGTIVIKDNHKNIFTIQSEEDLEKHSAPTDTEDPPRQDMLPIPDGLHS